jgi:PAS domain S-box-containing protein
VTLHPAVPRGRTDLLREVRVAGAGAAALGLSVIAGWLLGRDVLAGLGGGGVGMKPMTALCFVAAGIALLSRAAPGRRAHWAHLVSSVAVLALSATTLVEYLTDSTSPVDALGFDAVASASDWRMPFPTTIAFLAVGGALAARHAGRRVAAETLATVSGTIAFVAVVGHAYGADELRSVGPYSTVAVHSAVGLLLVAFGIHASIPGGALSRFVLWPGPGGQLTRRLLPATLVGLPVLGWIEQAGERAGWYDPAFGRGLLVTTAAAVLLVITGRAWQVIERGETERDQALARLSLLNLTLEARVSERTDELDRAVMALHAANKELARQQVRFRTVLDGLPIGVFGLDDDRRLVYVNRRYAEIIGRPGEDLLQGEARAAVHPGDLDGLSAAWNAWDADQSDLVLEFRGAPRDGQFRHLRSTIRVAHDSDRAHAAWVGALEDITSAVHDAAELAEARERFATAFSAAPIGIALVGLEDRVVFDANPALCELLRVEPDALRGSSLPEITHPDDQADQAEAFLVAVAGRRAASWEQRVRRVDGTTVSTVSHLSVVRGAGGGPSHGVLQLVDVTAERGQRELERLLHQLNRSVQRDLDLAQVLAAAAEEAGRALGATRVGVGMRERTDAVPVVGQWCTPRLEPLSEADAQAVFRLGTPADPDGAVGVVRIADAHEGGLDDHAARLFERIGIRSVLAVPVLVGEEVVATLAVGRADAHEWTEREVALVLAIAEEIGTPMLHAHLFEQKKQLALRLEELDGAKNDLVASVSHELRTPLTSIIGYLEMLRDGDAGAVAPEQAHLISIVERNAHRLRGLVEDLLTIARIESGAFSIICGPVDVSALVAEVVATVTPQLREKALHLDLAVEPVLPIVPGDAEQLARMLMNLLSNAAKFTAAGGTVRIGAHAGPDAVRIEIADTGIGIPAADLPLLFTRFFRAASAQHGAIPGTGLGLAIVKSIVERHGGSIAVASEPGVGTTFTISLPVAHDRRPADLTR